MIKKESDSRPKLDKFRHMVLMDGDKSKRELQQWVDAWIRKTAAGVYECGTADREARVHTCKRQHDNRTFTCLQKLVSAVADGLRNALTR